MMLKKKDKDKKKKMTISWVSQGSRVAGSTSPISVGCPASVSAGNLLLLMVTNKYSGSCSPDLPNGWTQLRQRAGGNGASGNDSGSMFLTIFYKIADGTEGGTNVSVSFTGSLNTSCCQIAQYSKTTGSWSLSSASGVDSVADTSWSAVTDTGGINVAAGDMLIGFGAFNGDLCTAVASEALSQSGVTFGAMTERWDDRSSSGSDSGFFMSEHPVSSGSGTGELTFTATMTGTGTNTPTGPSIIVRLREAATSTRVSLIDGGLVKRGILSGKLLLGE